MSKLYYLFEGVGKSTKVMDDINQKILFDIVSRVDVLSGLSNNSPGYKQTGIKGPAIRLNRLAVVIRNTLTKEPDWQEVVDKFQWAWPWTRQMGKTTAAFNQLMTRATKHAIATVLHNPNSLLPLWNPKRYPLGVQSFTYELKAKEVWTKNNVVN